MAIDSLSPEEEIALLKAFNERKEIDFNLLREYVSGKTPMNVLMNCIKSDSARAKADGKVDSSTSRVTLKMFIEYLMQMRFVTGQNFDSMISAKDVAEKKLRLAPYAIPVYDKDGNVYYDPSMIIDVKPRGILKLEKSEVCDDKVVDKIQSESMDAVLAICDELSKVTGIKLHPTSGPRGANIFMHSRASSIKHSAKMILRGEKFNNLSGVLYMRTDDLNPSQILTRYIAQCATMSISTSINSFERELQKDRDYLGLPLEEKQELLNKYRKAFKDNTTFHSNIHAICSDLISSEIIKTVPNLTAQERYTLSQGFILSAAQRINGLEDYVNDPYLMKFIASTVTDSISRYNANSKFTAADIRKVYEDMLFTKRSRTTTRDNATFGEYDLPTASKMEYTLTPVELVREADKTAETPGAEAGAGVGTSTEAGAEAGVGAEVGAPAASASAEEHEASVGVSTGASAEPGIGDDSGTTDEASDHIHVSRYMSEGPSSTASFGAVSPAVDAEDAEILVGTPPTSALSDVEMVINPIEENTEDAEIIKDETEPSTLDSTAESDINDNVETENFDYEENIKRTKEHYGIGESSIGTEIKGTTGVAPTAPLKVEEHKIEEKKPEVSIEEIRNRIEALDLINENQIKLLDGTILERYGDGDGWVLKTKDGKYIENSPLSMELVPTSINDGIVVLDLDTLLQSVLSADTSPEEKIRFVNQVQNYVEYYGEKKSAENDSNEGLVTDDERDARYLDAIKKWNQAQVENLHIQLIDLVEKGERAWGVGPKENTKADFMSKVIPSKDVKRDNIHKAETTPEVLPEEKVENAEVADDVPEISADALEVKKSMALVVIDASKDKVAGLTPDEQAENKKTAEIINNAAAVMAKIKNPEHVKSIDDPSQVGIIVASKGTYGSKSYAQIENNVMKFITDSMSKALAEKSRQDKKKVADIEDTNSFAFKRAQKIAGTQASMESLFNNCHRGDMKTKIASHNLVGEMLTSSDYSESLEGHNVLILNQIALEEKENIMRTYKRFKESDNLSSKEKELLQQWEQSKSASGFVNFFANSVLPNSNIAKEEYKSSIPSIGKLLDVDDLENGKTVKYANVIKNRTKLITRTVSGNQTIYENLVAKDPNGFMQVFGNFVQRDEAADKHGTKCFRIYDVVPKGNNDAKIISKQIYSESNLLLEDKILLHKYLLNKDHIEKSLENGGYIGSFESYGKTNVVVDAKKAELFKQDMQKQKNTGKE